MGIAAGGVGRSWLANTTTGLDPGPTVTSLSCRTRPIIDLVGAATTSASFEKVTATRPRATPLATTRNSTNADSDHNANDFNTGRPQSAELRRRTASARPPTHPGSKNSRQRLSDDQLHAGSHGRNRSLPLDRYRPPERHHRRRWRTRLRHSDRRWPLHRDRDRHGLGCDASPPANHHLHDHCGRHQCGERRSRRSRARALARRTREPARARARTSSRPRVSSPRSTPRASPPAARPPAATAASTSRPPAAAVPSTPPRAPRTASSSSSATSAGLDKNGALPGPRPGR